MSAVMAKQEPKEGLQLAVPGLGDRLRAARMACNLDLAKLAARIHLTSDMVDAIEREDYAELPARVFVRGYVRNYARAVNLPVDSVLAQFDRVWPDEESQVRVHESPGLATDVAARRRWPKVVTWLVVLAVIGLPLVWWQGYLDHYFEQGGGGRATPAPERSSEVAEPPASAPQAVVGAGELAPLPPAQTEPSSAPLEPATSASGASEESEQPTVEPSAEAASSGTVGEAAPLAPPGALAVSDVTETADSPVVEAEAASVSVAPPAGEVDEAAATVAEVPPKITLRFRKDSWVDVRDRTRTFKLVGIMEAGTEKTLGGEPPYNVVLGNAAAVDLSVDGRPYDLTPHMRGNVARFTLEP